MSKGVDNGAAEEQGQGPSLNALVQYTKDFSFENPNARIRSLRSRPLRRLRFR